MLPSTPPGPFGSNAAVASGEVPSQSVRIGANRMTHRTIRVTLNGQSVWARWLRANHAAARTKNGIRKPA